VHYSRAPTPSHFPAHTDCVRALLDNGADATLSNREGKTPVQCLPRAGANPQALAIIGQLLAEAVSESGAAIASR
jgi:ankyrin repeat protein